MKKNINRIFISIIFLIIGFSIGIIFMEYSTILNNSNIFSASFWGPVSDWVMVVVTIFTAYYLIQTFNEQKKANKIAYNNFILSIKPRFDVNFETEKYEDEKSQDFLRLKVQKNTLHNFNIIEFNSEYIYENMEGNQSIISIGDDVFFAVKPFEKKKQIIFKPIEVLIIRFSDSESNIYQQTVSLNFGFHWSISDPLLIDSSLK